jgi:hypothetical protein
MRTTPLGSTLLLRDGNEQAGVHYHFLESSHHHWAVLAMVDHADTVPSRWLPDHHYGQAVWVQVYQTKAAMAVRNDDPMGIKAKENPAHRIGRLGSRARAELHKSHCYLTNLARQARQNGSGHLAAYPSLYCVKAVDRYVPADMPAHTHTAQCSLCAADVDGSHNTVLSAVGLAAQAHNAVQIAVVGTGSHTARAEYTHCTAAAEESTQQVRTAHAVGLRSAGLHSFADCRARAVAEERTRSWWCADYCSRRGTRRRQVEVVAPDPHLVVVRTGRSELAASIVVARRDHGWGIHFGPVVEEGQDGSCRIDLGSLVAAAAVAHSVLCSGGTT